MRVGHHGNVEDMGAVYKGIIFVPCAGHGLVRTVDWAGALAR